MEVSIAIQLLLFFFCNETNLHLSNPATSRKFKIITGKGMHSGGAGAKLRPFFMNYLTKSGWKVDGGDDKGWIFVTGKL